MASVREEACYWSSLQGVLASPMPSFDFLSREDGLLILPRLSWTQDIYWTRFCCCDVLCHVRLFKTPWIVAHQAPLSLEFSRQEYWSGEPFPMPGDLPDSMTVLTVPLKRQRLRPHTSAWHSQCSCKSRPRQDCLLKAIPGGFVSSLFLPQPLTSAFGLQSSTFKGTSRATWDFWF